VGLLREVMVKSMTRKIPEIDYSKIKTQITQFFSPSLVESGSRIEINHSKHEWIIRIHETSPSAKLKTLEFRVPKKKIYQPIPIRTDNRDILHLFKNGNNCESSLLVITKDHKLHILLVEMKSTLKSLSVYDDLEKKVIGSAILILTILRFLEIDYGEGIWKVVFAYYKDDIKNNTRSYPKGDLIKYEAKLVHNTRPTKKYIRVPLPWGREFKVFIKTIETKSSSYSTNLMKII